MCVSYSKCVIYTIVVYCRIFWEKKPSKTYQCNSPHCKVCNRDSLRSLVLLKVSVQNALQGKIEKSRDTAMYTWRMHKNARLIDFIILQVIHSFQKPSLRCALFTLPYSCNLLFTWTCPVQGSIGKQTLKLCPQTSKSVHYFGGS